MNRIPAIATTLLVTSSLLPVAPAFAEDTAPAAAPAEAAASPFTFSGYVEASTEHFDGLAIFSNGASTRTFDIYPDSPSINQVAVTLAYQPKEGFGALLNVIGGRDPDIFAPYSINPGTRRNFDYPQAYVQYAHGPVTVIAGRYVTLAGYETIDPRTNSNFSRSVLYGFAIPFAHTGVRTTIAASDQVNVIIGVTNGWDDLKDTNTSKTAELGIGYTPSKTFNVLAQGYFGKERVAGFVNSGPEGMRKLIDVVATWNATDSLAVVLNYDWGSQDGTANTGATTDNADSAKWTGLAGYLNYQINDQWRTSLRLEYFDDKNGYRTGFAQKWKEGTFTVAFMPVKPVELRFEVRYDSSDSDVFVHSATVGSEGEYTDLRGHQKSIALEALYKF